MARTRKSPSEHEHEHEAAATATATMSEEHAAAGAAPKARRGGRKTGTSSRSRSRKTSTPPATEGAAEGAAGVVAVVETTSPPAEPVPVPVPVPVPDTRGLEEMVRRTQELQKQLQESAADTDRLRQTLAGAVGEVGEARRSFEAAGQKLLEEFRVQLAQAWQDLKSAREFFQSLLRLAEECRHGLNQVTPLLPDVRKQLRELDRAAGMASRKLHAVGAAAGEASGELEAVRQEAREAREGLEVVRTEAVAAESGLSTVLEKLEETGQRVEAAAARAPSPAPAHTGPHAPAAPESRNRLGVTVEPGVVVAVVDAGSAASSAGLLRGDVISAVNDATVQTAVELRDVVQGLKHDEDVKLRVIREGVPREVKARLQPAPANGKEKGEDQNHLGVTVEPGVVVAAVLPASPAAAAGLIRGDVISALNGTPVLTGEQLRQAVHQLPERAEIRLQVLRGEDLLAVYVRLDEPEATPPPPP